MALPWGSVPEGGSAGAAGQLLKGVAVPSLLQYWGSVMVRQVPLLSASGEFSGFFFHITYCVLF